MLFIRNKCRTVYFLGKNASKDWNYIIMILMFLTSFFGENRLATMLLIMRAEVS